MRYILFNHDTHHIFCTSDSLQYVINFYHKIARRKHSTILILDNTTGELIRIKAPKN